MTDTSTSPTPFEGGRKPGRRLPVISPVTLGYLIGPVALVVVLLCMHFGVIVRRPIELWIGVFVGVTITSLLADHLCRRHPSDLFVRIRLAQNVAAVTAVIYLVGWGPLLIIAFAFVALESMSRDGSQLWRFTALSSLIGIGVGQLAIWAGLASVLSMAHANEAALLGAFMLFFVIRMAAAIMERRESAESSLSQSEDRFRSLIQNSSDVTMVVNGGACTYVSPSVTAMLGFEPHELIGRPSAAFILEEDQERVSHHILSSGAANEPVSVQFRTLTKSGTLRLVEAVVADQRGRPSVGGFVASIRDITQRTETAKELRRSQESFQVLFEQHPCPMWVYDPETLLFLEVNKSAIDSYGYSRDEFLAKQITDIRPGEDAQKLLNYMQVDRPSVDYAGIWRHRKKSGELMDVEIITHTLEFRGRQAELVMAQDVTERIRLERQLHENALHDPVTGLPNRALLMDRMERLSAQAQRSSAEATVLCLNLDHFKLINETYGRDVGDGLLRAVGERLTYELTQADTVGRIAGSEFVVLVLDESPPELMAQRALDVIASQPFRVGGYELSVTASIGIVAAKGAAGGELIQNAEIAIDLAKAEGGNRYVPFAHEMQTALDERIQLTMDLRAAIAQGQFVNYYQPVVRLKDLCVVGTEALVRWRHPTRGLLPPGRFIPLAEETGTIRELGRMVLRQACEQATSWQSERRKLTVAVNVSVFQLRSDEFIAEVRDALDSSRLDPSQLVLEVTESVLINNPQTALTRLNALKDLGVRLAIDDFGTGYSSLGYLREFPFDILKVDQSFIASMAESPDAVAMVRTIIDLAHHLKLEVIAEGVETQQQVELLRGMKCGNVQGFLFSEPIAPEVLASVLNPAEADRSGEFGPRTTSITPYVPGFANSQLTTYGFDLHRTETKEPLHQDQDTNQPV